MLRMVGWLVIFLIPISLLVTLYFPQYWEILLVNLGSSE